MRKVLYLLFAIAALSSNCSAQFVSHYSTYKNVSLDSNGRTVHQSVEIDGYTTVPPNMGNWVTHSPRVQNQIGSIGGWMTGPRLCPTCYVSYVNDISADLNVGAVVNDAEEATMVCSYVGIFYSSLLFLGEMEIATTWSVGNGPAYGCVGSSCFRPLKNWCDAAHTPPDFTPTWIWGVGVAAPNYFIGSAVGVRAAPGYPWYFVIPGVGSPIGAVAPGPCTKNP